MARIKPYKSKKVASMCNPPGAAAAVQRAYVTYVLKYAFVRVQGQGRGDFDGTALMPLIWNEGKYWARP